ncbi:MAG: VPLPA-CTERM sorting domain-containing protein [Pseudomonadota bacterium]
MFIRFIITLLVAISCCSTANAAIVTLRVEGVITDVGLGLRGNAFFNEGDRFSITTLYDDNTPVRNASSTRGLYTATSVSYTLGTYNAVQQAPDLTLFNGIFDGDQLIDPRDVFSVDGTSISSGVTAPVISSDGLVDGYSFTSGRFRITDDSGTALSGIDLPGRRIALEDFPDSARISINFFNASLGDSFFASQGVLGDITSLEQTFADVPEVPLPASAPLMIAGLALLKRRRQNAGG